MNPVPGTQGYGEAIGSFVDTSLGLDFHEVCKNFVEFLPSVPARILDAGAGAGQNAAALADLGHTVVAVEPMQAFLAAARANYPQQRITWIRDSLPSLECLGPETSRFDFILVDAVWHHLDEIERLCALRRFAELLRAGARCALSLRNGPAGIGTRVFPTDAEQTVRQAARFGMDCVMRIENMPSILPNKEDVTWARIVLQKRRG